MDDFTVRIPDLPRFVSAYKGANRIVTDELKRAGKASALRVLQAVNRKAPVKTGHGRRATAVGAQTVSALAVSTPVGNAVPYMLYQDQGTGIYGPKHRPITPRNGRFLAWKTASGWVFARSVRGVRRSLWFTGTVQQMKQAIRDEHAKVGPRVIARLRART